MVSENDLTSWRCDTLSSAYLDAIKSNLALNQFAAIFVANRTFVGSLLFLSIGWNCACLIDRLHSVVMNLYSATGNIKIHKVLR